MTPADCIEKMVRAVTGIDIPIDQLVDKLKARQDKVMQDREGTVAGLMAEGTEDAIEWRRGRPPIPAEM